MKAFVVILPTQHNEYLGVSEISDISLIYVCIPQSDIKNDTDRFKNILPAFIEKIASVTVSRFCADESIPQRILHIFEYVCAVGKQPNIAKVEEPSIAWLATAINNKIITGKTKHPDFSKKTRSNYRKIKNYIYHNTRIWLKKNEIDIFIEELQSINPFL
jgi:hypothetical protein